MGVPFPDLETLEDVAFGIGSNMYEGFKPRKNDIQIIRDYCLGKISTEDLVKMTKDKNNV
jgi:hypothetical protein